VVLTKGDIIEEQKQIVKKIESLFKLCDRLEEQIESSKESSQKLMQSVLQEAFEHKENR
jgi:restriction endonuclease S subunit